MRHGLLTILVFGSACGSSPIGALEKMQKAACSGNAEAFFLLVDEHALKNSYSDDVVHDVDARSAEYRSGKGQGAGPAGSVLEIKELELHRQQADQLAARRLQQVIAETRSIVTSGEANAWCKLEVVVRKPPGDDQGVIVAKAGGETIELTFRKSDDKGWRLARMVVSAMPSDPAKGRVRGVACLAPGTQGLRLAATSGGRSDVSSLDGHAQTSPGWQRPTDVAQVQQWQPFDLDLPAGTWQIEARSKDADIAVQRNTPFSHCAASCKAFDAACFGKCPDHTPTPLVVKAGEVIDGVALCDPYADCLPGLAGEGLELFAQVLDSNGSVGAAALDELMKDPATKRSKQCLERLSLVVGDLGAAAKKALSAP